MERWPSGLRRRLGKLVYCQRYRGFESHSLRHYQYLFDISTNHNFSGVSVCHTPVTNDKIWELGLTINLKDNNYVSSSSSNCFDVRLVSIVRLNNNTLKY